MQLGLIGCGSIGAAVAQAVVSGRLPGFHLAGILDSIETEAGLRLAREAGCPHLADVDSFLRLKPDLVVEAASQQAVRFLAARVLEHGIDLMIVSIGALADADLLARLTGLAAARGCRLYVPSGAVGGLDVIKSASLAGLDVCRLTTIKPPKALDGVPYLVERGIGLNGLTAPTVVFEGTAAEAVRLFPQNVNVAASISMAGIGLQRTTVRIVADPAASRNIHEVFLSGAFGEASIRLENRPSPENAKTSYLAALSVLATLKRIGQPLQLGT